MADLHILSPQGFKAAGVTAGIKASGKPDVALLAADASVTAAALFTTNKVFAAPVAVGREHVRSGKLRAIIVNSGNANACTGKQGLKDAKQMCAETAKLLGAKPADVLPSSTGIIGHTLPMPKVLKGIRMCAGELGSSAEHALAFNHAIMTTDAFRKHAATTLKIGRELVTIAGVCKGAGMIGPRMGPPQATMLAYLTTDIATTSPGLQRLLIAAVGRSFNAVTVDDHTSTNDTAVLLASGASGATLNPTTSKKFLDALTDVCVSLAKQIASDGEGATKVVKIVIRRAANEKAAQAIARAIANSNLVKCAMHGNDPNWGRIVSAAGLAGVPFDPERSTLKLQSTTVFAKGTPVKFDAKKVSGALKQKEVEVDLDCRLGSGETTLYTCDLSREYVAINADYST
ncbi:MAG: bifunctional glutamate N-acetyltransferase/amino-acid acetyltransferase ArgJ [Tepidisphaeraceae bacterium]